MRVLSAIKRKIANAIQNWKTRRREKRCRRLYSDFHEKNEYDDGEYKFIWGVKSPDDLCKSEPCLATMNDIELVYSRKEEKYMLSIETAYWLETKENEIKYLEALLKLFTDYMVKSGLELNDTYRFWMSRPAAIFEGELISEVYTSFRIFVEGYKSLYGQQGEKVDEVTV